MSDIVSRPASVVGTGTAADLLPLVYDELRKLTAVRMAAERPGHTLQTTALVHEAYARLVRADPDGVWNCRGHFFTAAAEAMRRILVDAARRKGRAKRGGGHARVTLDDVPGPAPDDDLLALDEALTALARVDADKAELVKLRYFDGLTLEEAAACQGVSLATTKRRWTVARAWLFDALSAGAPPAPSPNPCAVPRPDGART